MQQIINSLEELFAEQDKISLEQNITWIKGRVTAIQELRESPEFKNLHYSERYETLFQTAGGKGWFNVISGRSMQMIVEIMTEKHKETCNARNVKIAKKLIAAGINEIRNGSIVMTNDGFNGVYVVEGRTITIQTILAAGDVQRLHQRVLVKVGK